MGKAPIALFVYDRLYHTQKTIEALQKNEGALDSRLFIFSDGPKFKSDLERITEVREYIDKIDGFKEVTLIKQDKNIGLANSIVHGITNVINQYEKVIVIEDDIQTSKWFLKYMNDALTRYKDEKKIGAVTGYFYNTKNKLPETFLLHYFNCWGWATWKDRWQLYESDSLQLINEITSKGQMKEFNINNTYPYFRMLKNQAKGKNNSWAIRFYASLFINKKYVLYPGTSLVQNLGFDETGTHGDRRKIFNTSLSQTPISIKEIPILQSEKGFKELQRFYKSIRLERIISRIRRTIKIK